jgi:parallel beta-helix repeat protein
MPTAGPGIAAFGYGRVVFKVGAGIYNPPPPPGLFCAWVYTDEEPDPVEACYHIRTGPVDVYLKYQVPEMDCGYIEWEDYHVSSFQNIQDALDYANEIFLGQTIYDPWNLYATCPEEGGFVGCKIVVQPGTYYESLEIDTPGVELVSADGAATTIIDGTDVCPAHGVPTLVYISTGGVTFDGFTVRDGGDDIYWDDVYGHDCGVDWNWDGDPNQDIDGIKVEAQASPKSGAPLVDYMAIAADARVNILNNIVTNNQDDGIVVLGSNVLVRGNEVTGNDENGFYGEGLRCGVEICDPEAYTNGYTVSSEILDNIFHMNGDDGIDIESASGCDNDIDLYIIGNTCSENGDDGIDLEEYATDYGATVISIKFNQILNNDEDGIVTDAYYPTFSIICVYNDIVGNAQWGIKNWDPDLLIAKMNWWGDRSGPSDGVAPLHPDEGNPDQTAIPPALGEGDAVSHNVIYQWWLTDEFENVQLDLVRYYGSDRYQGMDEFYDSHHPWSSIPWAPVIPLQEGWNTLSVPVALDTAADQLGEIQALGDWLTDENWEVAYTYEAGAWTLCDASFQFVPLQAIYIRMNGPEMYDPWMDQSYVTIFPILLRSGLDLWLPARDLDAGWNLVGLNSDIWNEEQIDINLHMTVKDTLVSIDGSWSTAISPSMPGQYESWVCTTANAGDFDMIIGDGYWVFVTEPTTLAGLSVAPWYLNEWEMEILNCQIPEEHKL